MGNLSDYIKFGHDALNENRLDDAEQSFEKALKSCSSSSEKEEVIDGLLKLLSAHLDLNQSAKPKVLFELIDSSEFDEKVRLLETLARVHQKRNDIAQAELLFTRIFELRARTQGPAHPETISTLKTAALFRQFQGLPANDLYAKATAIAKEIGLSIPLPQSKKRSEENSDSVASASANKALVDGDKQSGADKSPVEELASNQGPVPRDNPHVADEHKPEDLVREARKKSGSKKSTLYLLDELIVHQGRSEPISNSDKVQELTTDEVPDFSETSLTLKASLQELLKEWEAYCNVLTRQLVKLLQQSPTPSYRQVLNNLTTMLNEKTAKLVDLDHPFLKSKRKPADRYLDWSIVQELVPVYSAYDGTWATYPFEIGMIYSCLRRAFELGPLHVDTLQSLYRLAHIYTNEMFGCYDLEFAASTFKICVMAFREHPEIDELSKVRCRTSLANVLMAQDKLSEAKAALKDAIKVADALDAQLGKQELLTILKILAECTARLGDYETAIGVCERMRGFQETVARDAELFETLIQLVRNYGKLGDTAQVTAYLQKIQTELDCFEDPNPMREIVALKAEDLGEYFLAEKMLNDIMANCKPYDAIAGRVASILIRIYDKTGRTDLAARLRGNG